MDVEEKEDENEDEEEEDERRIWTEFRNPTSNTTITTTTKNILTSWINVSVVPCSQCRVISVVNLVT